MSAGTASAKPLLAIMTDGLAIAGKALRATERAKKDIVDIDGVKYEL